MKQTLTYLLANWKMVAHLLFRTGHFGVNNTLWSTHRSLFGARRPGHVLNLARNYRMMRLRAFSGFIPLNQALGLFPGHAVKHGYKPITPLGGKGKGETP
jgi:hypothetical protein